MKDTNLNEAAAALGRKGGAAKTEAKQAASRANGKKGGRPRTKYKIVSTIDGYEYSGEYDRIDALGVVKDRRKAASEGGEHWATHIEAVPVEFVFRYNPTSNREEWSKP